MANCYRNALKLAERYEIDSIAFPAISTGIFGYPLEEAAQVTMKTFARSIDDLKYVKKIRFVLYDKKTLEVHERYLKENF